MKKFFIVALAVVLMGSFADAKEIAGVTLSDTLNVENKTLLLNGGGIRKKFFIKVYVAGLYLLQKEKDGNKIINDDAPMAIRLQITSGLIDSEKMETSLRDGFKKSTKGNIAPYAKRIDQFSLAFKEKIQEGDKYDLIYIPGKGVETHKNGKKIDTIPGLDFKKVLFAIWLSDKPASKDLKKAMLGR